MKPKCIILKTQSKEFLDAFIYKLNEFKTIRFFSIKMNGFYTVVIKCHNYYHYFGFQNKSNVCASYIFLYSVISIILSDLFLTYYEHLVSRRMIAAKKNMNLNLNKLSSISSLLLDEHSPFELSETLYKRRKNLLLETLLKNFRKCNYIYTDYFVDFFAKSYIEELEKIIDASIEILNNKFLYHYMMTFVFQNN